MEEQPTVLVMFLLEFQYPFRGKIIALTFNPILVTKSITGLGEDWCIFGL